MHGVITPTTADDLVEPVSDDLPVGEDLSYDPERQEIEQAFDAASVSADAAAEVDWRETIRLIEAQSRRTKDLWLAVYLARAGTRAGGLVTVEKGCLALAELLDRYWPAVHPSLDEYGLEGRMGACESLTRFAEFLGPLQRVTLIEHPRLGAYTAADFARFDQDGDGAEGFGMFRAALSDTGVETVQDVIARLDGIAEALRRVDTILTLHASEAGVTSTNFAPTFDAIAGIRRSVLPYAGLPGAADGEDHAAEGDVATASDSRRVPGRIDNRDDVIRAIDAIADYYERREPSSPIPLALRRVRGWVSSDFMTIMKDIAPNSMNDVGTVLLARENNGGGGGMM
jgi:type VI secretion system ImpA family protein